MISGIILQVTQPANALTDTMVNAMNNGAPATEEAIPLWDLLIKGGPILIPIAVLSVAALYIFFERFFISGSCPKSIRIL